MNQFECTYQGSFDDVHEIMGNRFTILEHKENHQTHYLKVQVSNEFSNNQFLNLLMQKVEVGSFNEVIPRMDDIFIRVVENDSKTNPQTEIQ